MADGSVSETARAYAFPDDDDDGTITAQALSELADVLEVVSAIVGSGVLADGDTALRDATVAVCFRAQRRAALVREHEWQAHMSRKKAAHA